MALVKIECGVQLLGNAVVKNGKSTYSLIEFKDGQILKDVTTDSKIDNFLQRTIKTNEPTILWLQKNGSEHRLLGLKIGDKTYVDYVGYSALALHIIGGIMLIPVLGYGIYALMLIPRTTEAMSITNSIINENPNAQKL